MAKRELEWDLASFFRAGVDARAFGSEIERSLTALEADGADRDLESLLAAIEPLEADVEHLRTFLDCLRAVDRNAADAPWLSVKAISAAARLASLWGLVRTRLAELGEAAFEALLAEPALAGASPRLRRERREGLRGLTPAEQALAADLMADSVEGWADLAEETLNRLVFRVGDEETTFARRFDYFWGPDPAVRHAAWEGLQQALAGAAPVLAACLNGLMGTRLTLLRRRGREPVEDVAERNALSPATLAAMIAAAKAQAGPLHDYLDFKRARLGLDRLWVCDRWAPLPQAVSAPLPQDAIVERVRAALERVSPLLARGVDRMMAAGLIDAGPGPGRQSGAFCAFAPLSGGPRVFLNTDGGFYSQTTFAHELGHAFHGEVLGSLRPLRRQAPASLAETASITCEHVFREGVLRDPASTAAVKAEALVAELDSAVNYVLRIPRDFEFEAQVYQARAASRLTREGLTEIQNRTHHAWFGDRLGEDPLAWAGNPLLFASYTDFYNFSYTFGFLLACAIAEAFDREGEGFQGRYEAFLAATDTLSGEDVVAATLGFDLRDPGFWNQAMGRCRRRVSELKAVLGDMG